MKIGDLVFFNSESFYAKFIRYFNRIKYGESGWSHVGIITKINSHSVEIYEAIGSGFTRSEYQYTWLVEQMNKGKVTIKQPKGRITKVREYAKKYEGRGYGYFDIWLIALNTLFGFKFGGSANRLICSEAVARILYDASNKKINFEKEYNKAYSLITPIEVYRSRYLK